MDARSDASLDEDVVLVGADDVPLGTMPKLEAHRRGMRHRAISVIVRDGQGRLLMQQRAAGKYHSAGLWTNTCCSHPRPGEDVHEAAARRLAEEMGIDCALSPLFVTQYRAEVSNGMIENEIVHVFAGTFEGSPEPDPSEIAGWAWRTPAEIARDIAENPDKFTPWFRIYCRDFWGAMTG